MSEEFSTNIELINYPIRDLAENIPISQDISIDLDSTRRETLAKIDDSEFGCVHLRTCIIAGAGFLMSAYHLFSINLVSAIFGYIYFANNKNDVPISVDTGLKSSATFGAILGLLLFGWMADKYGRKKMYGFELVIMTVAAVGSALSGSSFAINMFSEIIFWRIILGMGIGGDYVLSAVITSEFVNKKRRGLMIALVFAMQGIGILLAGLVFIVTLRSFKFSIQNDVLYLDYVWRIMFGIGAIPTIAVLFFRMTIQESPRFMIDVKGVIKRGYIRKNKQTEKDHKVVPPKATFRDFREYFGRWKNGKILFATSFAWFAIDMGFYGIGFNQGIILNAIKLNNESDPYQSLYNVAIGNIAVTTLGTVPGYWCCILLIDKLGRKFIQQMGFAVLTILYIVLGLFFHIEISPILFTILFTISMFFINFGPNTTTFVIPGEVFPTRYRCTGYAISAASGKLGAVLSQVFLLFLKDVGGKNHFLSFLFLIFAAFAFAGFLCSYLIPETKHRSLEENSNEVQKGFIKRKH